MNMLEHLQKYCVIERDILSRKKMYRLTFSHKGTKCQIRMRLEGDFGADIIITNIVVLPERKRGVGYGSLFLKQILKHAINCGLEEVHVVRVQKQAIKFWEENGFKPIDGNPTQYAYRGPLLSI